MPPFLSRHQFLLGAGATLVSGLFPRPTMADVPVAYDWNATPPTDSRAGFIE